MITRRTMICSLLAAPVAGSLIPTVRATPVIMNWDGAILHEPSEQLIAYTQEIMKEYVRTNLFSL